MGSSPTTGGTRINSRRRFSLLAPALIAAAVAGSGLLSPSRAVARSSSKALACRAWVRNTHPSEYSTTTVYVETAARAHVTASAHYLTTTDTQSSKANGRGRAAIRYDVSDATAGFKVIVTVRVQNGSRSGDCRTSYVPE